MRGPGFSVVSYANSDLAVPLPTYRVKAFTKGYNFQRFADANVKQGKAFDGRSGIAPLPKDALHRLQRKSRGASCDRAAIRRI